MCQKINGWNNHETYSMVLLLQNDVELYDMSEQLKAESESWAEFSDKLKEFFQELIYETKENPTKEIVALLLDIGSLSDVDFDQIAKSFLEIE